MNVWTYLGLTEDHRPTTKTVQLVKHADQVKPEKMNWPLLAEQKHDGIYTMFVNGDHGYLGFGRSGKKLSNLGVHEAMMDFMAEGRDQDLVYITEFCSDDVSLEQLSGLVNPNRKKDLTDDETTIIEKCYCVFHDLLTTKEFIEGESESPLSDRQETLSLLVGPEVMPRCRACLKQEDADSYFKAGVEDGWEGIVLKDTEAGWKAGRRDHNVTKMVRGVDFDLLVTGVEEGEGKRRDMVANLLVRWKPYADPDAEATELRCDGRIDDETRIRWWKDPDLVVGSIVHVHALQIGSKGALRLPKFHSIRIDKTEPDL